MVQKQLIHNLLKRIKSGGITVTYWDGDTKQYGTTSNIHLTLTDPSIVTPILKNTSLGVGEAYMDGKLLVDGPLEDLVELGFRNLEVFNILNHKHKLHRNTKRTQPDLIKYHYDIGNDFYKLWLDTETLGYTCSYYHKPTDSLEDAQLQKFDHVLNKLQLEKGHTLLDIGFGWGYLLVRAAKRFGVRGVGVSLSKEQVKFANELAKKHGVSKLVEFRLMNYQDLPQTKEQFDRVVSIGFVEHVGWGNHATYFKTVQTVLKDGGVSVLHCISQQKEVPTEAWIDKYIFPGGYVPSIREITNYLPDYDFRLVDYENIGPHYIPTLYEWWNRFEKHKDQIIDMYDERFYRMWRLYLAGSIANFKLGQLGLSQWTFTKGYVADWPLTREYLYTGKPPVRWGDAK